MGDSHQPQHRHQQLAPAIEVYAPQPRFKYAPPQRQIDFAQLIAAGAAPVDALIEAHIVPPHDAETTPQKVLYKMAATLLRTEAVQERIDHFVVLHKLGMESTVERIKQEAASMAFSDFALSTDPDTGDPITNPHELPRHFRAAVKEFYIDANGNHRYKFHDKIRALQMLGDLEGHFDESNRSKAPVVNINLGDGGAKPPPIDITPQPTTEVDPMDCLK